MAVSLMVAAAPGRPATHVAGVPFGDIEIIGLDGRPARRGEVAAALRDRLPPSRRSTYPPMSRPAGTAWSSPGRHGQPGSRGNDVRVICSSPPVRTRRTE